MPFGALQQGKSYRQLWRRPVNHTPPSGRGAASLVLGSDALDETAVLQSGDAIVIDTTDSDFTAPIQELGLEVLVTNTIMKTAEEKTRLADDILTLARHA